MKTETFICEHYGEQFPISELVQVGEDILCEACAETHTTFFEHCAQIRNERTVLHSFDYKTEPIFYGEGLRHLGVELEIDEGGRLTNMRRSLRIQPMQPIRTSTSKPMAPWMMDWKSSPIR